MRLTRVNIENYKSLKRVDFAPDIFSTLVGPNASGKSNFSDSLDFLSNVYKHGLETAVSIKGGYENIAFRKQRRSRSAISFLVEVTLNKKEFFRALSPFRPRAIHKGEEALKMPSQVQITHYFSIKTKESGIKADFRIIDEQFTVCSSDGGADAGDIHTAVVISRKQSNDILFEMNDETYIGKLLGERFEYFSQFMKDFPISDQELFVSNQLLSSRVSRNFSEAMSRISVYKLSPELSRLPGVPTPNPTLKASGENLPAMVDWLQRRHPKQWDLVLSAMRDIVPTLEDILVQYLHTKTLGLFFKEENVARPWSTEDVSDGTVQTLGMLVALVDPRSTMLLIEEPENSVHPWIIRELVNRFREISKIKTVLITTHSPVLIDMISPSELWVVYKKRGETNITKITELDCDIESDWENGNIRLSEYLDTGLLPQAIPGGTL